MRTDVHQHLWPEALLEALSRRRRPPFLRTDGDGTRLTLAGEPDCPVLPADHDVSARAELVAADGLDLALVCLSSPLGIECLPPDEAATLLAAYHDGVAALPPAFAGWAAAALVEPDPLAVAAELDRGFVGLSLPAGAVASPAGLERVGPLLELLERRGLPLLVHPGPAPWSPFPAAGAGDPAWWPALTTYVAQMNAAWHAFHAVGRSSHPTLRVLFPMLAGGGPLHAERLARRGGGVGGVDPLVYLDASSYGPRGLDAVVRVVGIDQIVYGSDRPVIGAAACPLGAAAAEAMLVRNPSRLLGPLEVPA